MHDEAALHYIDIIDQTTYGHKFIKDQFNVTTRIGWQIDPLGHSAVQAYLLGAETELSEKGINNLRSSGGALRVLVHLHRCSGNGQNVMHFDNTKSAAEAAAESAKILQLLLGKLMRTWQTKTQISRVTTQKRLSS